MSCATSTLHAARLTSLGIKCGLHSFVYHRMSRTGLANAAVRIVHAGPAVSKIASRGSFTANSASSAIRKAEIATAPRLALQQIYTQRGRDLERSKAAADVPSQQSLQEVEETLGYVQASSGALHHATS